MSENEHAIEGEIVPAPQTGLSLGSLPMADPTEIVLRATEVAKVLTKVIKDQHLSRNIQGREYVYVTGWSTLGAMLGIMARETPGGTYAREDGSYVGSVDLIRVSDGMVIGGGTAVVGMDEKDRDGKLTWGARPEYARRSMAVTRAAGKAYRLTLAWIMALAGFEGTPAEEMDGLNLNDDDGFSKPKPKAPQTAQAPRRATQPAAPVQPHGANGKRPYSASGLREAIANSISARVAKDAAKAEAATDDAARKLATKWRNVMTGTTPDVSGDKARYAIASYLMSGEITTFKGLAVATVEALDKWLHDDPKSARAEAGNVWQELAALATDAENAPLDE